MKSGTPPSKTAAKVYGPRNLLSDIMLRLAAIQYRQTFTSGHSCPCLIEAESLEGERFEIVLKMRGCVHGGYAGLAREAIASQLATALDLNTPEPFLIEITPEFAASVATPEVRTRFEENSGCHYGSRYLGPGWHAVPYGDDLPHNLIDRAASVLAFDALIRNDDRHFEKANYLVQGLTVMVIDHERAFPTAPMIPRPWEPEGLEHLRQHVFFRGLKGQLPDFEPISAAFAQITNDDYAAWVGAIPEEWDAGGISADVYAYLMALRANFRNVLTATRRLLR